MTSHIGLLSDETTLTDFHLRGAHATVYPLFISTSMLRREWARRADALEVLALLPKYCEADHGYKDTADAQHTYRRRELSWKVLGIALAPLIPGTSDWCNGPAGVPCEEDEFELPFAFIGTDMLFGRRCSVWVVPLLYIAGTWWNCFPCAFDWK